VSLLTIALGATLGAWLRFALGLWLNPTHALLTVGTLVANLLGAYVIGLALAWFDAYPHLAAHWRAFIITGLLGSLTTFSSFSAEILQLLQRQKIRWALLGVVLHLLGSLFMTALGWFSYRSLSQTL